MFYCAGFLRVELELNEQKKRINALENNEETSSTSSDVPSLNQLAKKTLGKLLCISSGLALIPEKVCVFIFSWKINLVSPENFAYRFSVFTYSWRSVEQNQGWTCKNLVLGTSSLFKYYFSLHTINHWIYLIRGSYWYTQLRSISKIKEHLSNKQLKQKTIRNCLWSGWETNFKFKY